MMVLKKARVKDPGEKTVGKTDMGQSTKTKTGKIRRI